MSQFCAKNPGATSLYFQSYKLLDTSIRINGMVRGNKDQLTPLKIYQSHFTTEFWLFNLISKRSQNEHHFFYSRKYSHNPLTTPWFLLHICFIKSSTPKLIMVKFRPPKFCMGEPIQLLRVTNILQFEETNGSLLQVLHKSNIFTKTTTLV